MCNVVFLYLLIVNMITFAAFGLDKSKAKRHEWRIPERTLMGFAALGGSLGALLGMKIFRHKTRHAKFTVGVPMFLVLHIIMIVLLLRYYSQLI